MVVDDTGIAGCEKEEIDDSHKRLRKNKLEKNAERKLERLKRKREAEDFGVEKLVPLVFPDFAPPHAGVAPVRARPPAWSGRSS